jgi:hypothetical protein
MVNSKNILVDFSSRILGRLIYSVDDVWLQPCFPHGVFLQTPQLEQGYLRMSCVSTSQDALAQATADVQGRDTYVGSLEKF